MLLTEAERRVLPSIRLDADVSIPTLARALGMKETSVRNAVRGLTSKGVIRKFTFINPAALGLVEYDVIAALTTRGGAARSTFFEFLVAQDEITAVEEVGGDCHCIFTVCSRSPATVNQVLARIGNRFGSILRNTSICVTEKLTLYPPKYLGRTRMPLKMVENGIDAAPVEIDAHDLRILRSLSNNPSFSAREVATSLRIPVATVLYRLRKLKSSKVLLGSLYSIRPQVFGFAIFRVHLALRCMSNAVAKRVQAFSEQHPNVTYTIAWVGSWNFCLGVTTPTANDAAELVNGLHDEFGEEIGQISLMPVSKHWKLEFLPVL